MDRVRCAQCGKEHDLGDVEPSFDRPDAYFDIPADERTTRTWNAQGLCIIRADDDMPPRHFIRALLSVAIRGTMEDICWGIWVEVDEPSFALVRDHWDDPDQASVPPLRGTLANLLPGMEPTLGLPGELHVVSPSQYPYLTLDLEAGHRLAEEQRDGVYPERALEWRASAYHS